MTRHSGTEGTSDWLKGAVKNHPEGLLLLAAGCALLLRSGASAGSAKPHGRSSGASSARQHSQDYYDQRPSGTGISESISQAANSAREYAADVGKTVSDKAGSYASAVGQYTDDALRQSEHLVGQARTNVQQTIDRVLQVQPLAVAVAGLAAGAAIAAAFPATAVERHTLGAAGERLSEAANNAGQHLSEAASKAGEKLMNVAEERGLNTAGLREVASDVAGAFTGALGGEQNGRGGDTFDTGSSAQPSSAPASAAPQPAQTSGSRTGSGQESSLSGRTSKPGTPRQS